MIAHYVVNDCIYDHDFKKIKTLRKVTTKKGTEDYEIYFDGNEHSVLMSNITTIEDYSGNLYCGNIINILKKFVV